MQIDIGIPVDDRERIAGALSKLLADSYTLYVKTHNFHWNVTGPMFQALHTMFEEHYTELSVAVDEIAERIRSLGHRAPGSFGEFLQLAKVADEPGDVGANEMIRRAVAGHEAVTRTARNVFQVAAAADDEATADLAVGRLRLHEKTAWMLRSMLDD